MTTGTPLAFTAAIFDCDGTLVDTAAYWRSAYESVVGEKVSDDVMRATAGASTRSAAALLTRFTGRTVTAASIDSALLEAVASDQPAPLPGAHELLSFLSDKLRLAVATNAPRAFVDKVLGRRLRPCFEFVVASEDLNPPRDKPHPDVYLEACRRLGVASSEAIAFEDAAIGATSAASAKLALVVVSANGDDPIVSAQATLAVDRLDDPRIVDLLKNGRL